jgi:hypothetical protein
MVGLLTEPISRAVSYAWLGPSGLIWIAASLVLFAMGTTVAWRRPQCRITPS